MAFSHQFSVGRASSGIGRQSPALIGWDIWMSMFAVEALLVACALIRITIADGRGLVEAILRSSESLSLKFEEFVKLLIILIGNCIDKFGI